MNRINPFEGLVISSEDLKYIQSSIEEYFVKALSVTSNFPETNGKGGVALGFNLLLSGTKVQVFNNNSMNVGYAMDGKGRVIEFKPVSTNGIFLTPDNYNAGQLWVVAVRVIEEFGSYNPDTQGVDVGVENRISLVESIPGESGGTRADRVVQEYKIDVFSEIDFIAQQTETGNAWVELGRFKTNGVDSISNVPLNLSDLSTDNLINIAGRFTQGSVTINQISNELLPFFKELLVNLDDPTIGYYVEQKNRGRFVDSDVLLTKTNGDAIDLFAGEFSTTTPRVLVRRDNSFDSAPVGISDQFGNPVFSHTFTVTADNNFGMTYNPTLTHVSLFVGTLDFLSPGTSIDGRILDANQAVIAEFSTSVNNLVAQSWNKFQLSSAVVVNLGSSYTLQVRKSDSNSGFSIYAQTGIFAYRIWHRPASGSYGDDVRLYDEFGDLTQLSEDNDRNTAKGIVRYIPYAAIINDYETFSPYVASEEEIDEFRPVSASDRRLKFVAIDVRNGRFFFSNGQAPTEDVVVKCSFKQLLFDLSAARIQRKSQSESTYFESVESALLRLERLSNPEILVKRRGSPLVKVLPISGGLHSSENKFRFISTDSLLKDATGTPFSEDSVGMPEAQLKIDAFNNVVNSGTYQITENYTLPRKALVTISYLSLAGPDDGDRLNINGKVYEFDNNSNIGSGNISVPILGTTDNTFSQLVSKINASDTQIEAVQDTVNKKVTIYFREIGAQGNSIEIIDTTGAVPSRYVFLDYNNVPTGTIIIPGPTPQTRAYFSGGTWGSVIPFKPRFTNHTGLILTLIKSATNVSGFGSITVDIYAGTNYTETNLNNLIKIGQTGRITPSTVDSITDLVPTSVYVDLPATFDFNLYTDYYYKIKTDAVPVGGNLELEIESSTSLIGFQQLFTSAPGLATSELGYDIFDSFGSIFKPSPNRQPRVVKKMSQLQYTGTAYDLQVQGEAFPLDENPSYVLPVFSPPTISDIYLSNIGLLISESTSTDGEIIVTLHDENNQVVGTPQRVLLPNPIVDPLSTIPVPFNPDIVTVPVHTSTGTMVIYPNAAAAGSEVYYPGIPLSVHSDPTNVLYRGPVQIEVPYPAILDIRKRYHVHVQTTTPNADLKIGTNGTSSTGQKWLKISTSEAYVPIYADLSDDNWESIVLPNDFYVAVDHRLGRIKFNDNARTGSIPPGGNLTSNFNISIPFNSLSSETLIRPDGTSVEDALNSLSSNINLVNDFVGEKVHYKSSPGVYAFHSRDVALTKRGVDSTVPYLPSQVTLEAGQDEILLKSIEAKVKGLGTYLPVTIQFTVPVDPYGSTLTQFPLSTLYLHVFDPNPTSATGPWNLTVKLRIRNGPQIGPTVVVSNSIFSRGFDNPIPFDPEKHIVETGVSYDIELAPQIPANNDDILLANDVSGATTIDYRLFYILPSGYYGSSDGNYQIYLGNTDVTLDDIKQWPMKYPLYGKQLDLVPFIGNEKTVGFVENIHEGGAVISLERYDLTERKFFPFEEEILFCAPKEINGVRTIDVISKKHPTRIGEFTVGIGDIAGTNLITLSNHGFNDKFLLQFSVDGGSTVNGGAPGTTVYEVKVNDANTFYLRAQNGVSNLILTANSAPATFEVITSNTKINYRQYDYATGLWSDAVLIYEEPAWKQDVNSICIRNGQNSTTRSYNDIFIALVSADGQTVYIADNYDAAFSSPAVPATGFTLSPGESWGDVKLFVDDYFYGTASKEARKYCLTLVKTTATSRTLHYAKRIIASPPDPADFIEADFSVIATPITQPVTDAPMQNVDVAVTDTGYWFAAVLMNGASASQYKYSVVRGTDFMSPTTSLTVGSVISTLDYVRKTIPSDHPADEIGLNSPSGNEVGKDGWKVILGSGPLTGDFSSASAGDLAVWSELHQSWEFHKYIKFTGIFSNYSDKSVRLLGVSEYLGDYLYTVFPFSWSVSGTPSLSTLIELNEDAKVPLHYIPPKFYRKDLTISFLGLNDSFTEAKTLNIFERRMPFPQGKNNAVNYVDPFKRFSGLGVDPINSYVHFDYALGKAITTDHTVSVNLQNVADDLILNPKGWSDWTDEMLDKQRPQEYANGWFGNYKFLRLDRWGTYIAEETPYVQETNLVGGVQYEILRTKLLSLGEEYPITGTKVFISSSVKNGYYALALILFPEGQLELVAPYTDSLIKIPVKFLTNEYFYRTGISQGILIAEVEKT